MLNWLVPSAFWILASIIPVLILYFLRIRFKKQNVSSNYIWIRLKKENQSNRKLHFRSVLLLVLQIIIVLMLAGSAAQPVWNSLKAEKPGMVFLLDISSSMSARDISDNNIIKNRWDKGREILAEEIKNLPEGTEVAVFTCSAGIERIGKEKKNYTEILNKLKSFHPNGAGFQESSVTEGLDAWLKTENKKWTACLISDGGLDLNGQKISSLFNNNIKVILLGSEGKNLGVTALRFLHDGKAQFTVINSYGTQKKANIILERDNKLISSTGLNIQPGWSVQSLPMLNSIQPGVYTIRLDANDIYPADDRYFLVISKPLQIRLLLAGKENPFLKAALKHPDIILSHVGDLASNKSRPETDITVVYNLPVPDDWEGNLLCFNTAPRDGPVSILNPVAGPVEITDSMHPLIRFANMREWYISKGNSLKLSPEAAILLKIDNNPILAVWEKKGNHYAVLGADLKNSNIGISSAFPIFIQNYIMWCVPQRGNQLAYTLTAGKGTFIKATGAWKISKINKTSSGDISDWSGIISINGSMLRIVGLSPGVFAWEEGLNSGFIAVNIPSNEMDLNPRGIQVSPHQAIVDTYEINQQKKISFLPLIILLFFLCAEWYVWRGVRIRRPEFRIVKG